MAAASYRVCGAKSGRLIPNCSGLGNNGVVSPQADVTPAAGRSLPVGWEGL